MDAMAVCLENFSARGYPNCMLCSSNLTDKLASVFGIYFLFF